MRLVVCRYDFGDEDDEDDDGGERRDSVDEGRGFCQPYRGDACSGHLGSEIVYVTERFRAREVDESLRGRITIQYNMEWKNANGIAVTLQSIELLIYYFWTAKP